MKKDHQTFLSIILPCYNEEAMLENNLNVIYNYLVVSNRKYNWEILVINDGSIDKTGLIAEEFAKTHKEVVVVHNTVNLNLGRTLQKGFKLAKGEVIVVLDIDLSYSVDHIDRMVSKLEETCSDIVVASPYMKGGKVTAVPFLRKMLSKWVNKFMRMAAQEKFYTFTGMVRAYKKEFIKDLNLKTYDYEINPEILYKAMILRARITEIPAHLDWTEQRKYKKRTSSIRLFRGFLSGLMSGFIFRPYFFFIGIGLILLIISLYILVWLLFDTLSIMQTIDHTTQNVVYPFSYSLAILFERFPHSFIIGGITFIAAIQFLSLGFLSLQSKRYFEELFHITTNSLKQKNEIN